jgi:predicted lipid-binding transport protein (Tim44 family)
LWGKSEGCLTTLFQNTAMMPIAAPKKKSSLMPGLTIVFLISYGLMAMLIVEQGKAIQAQHNLIQVLQRDSTEFWAMKGKEHSDKAAHDRAHAHAAGTQNPSANGKAQTPSTQAPHQSPTAKASKQHIQMPPVPASDMGDQRRVLITL